MPVSFKHFYKWPELVRRLSESLGVELDSREVFPIVRGKLKLAAWPQDQVKVFIQLGHDRLTRGWVRVSEVFTPPYLIDLWDHMIEPVFGGKHASQDQTTLIPLKPEDALTAASIAFDQNEDVKITNGVLTDLTRTRKRPTYAIRAYQEPRVVKEGPYAQVEVFYQSEIAPSEALVCAQLAASPVGADDVAIRIEDFDQMVASTLQISTPRSTPMHNDDHAGLKKLENLYRTIGTLVLLLQRHGGPVYSRGELPNRAEIIRRIQEQLDTLDLPDGGQGKSTLNTVISKSLALLEAEGVSFDK